MARKPRKTDDEQALSPAEEYRAALADFTSYSSDNETPEALAARDRLDQAETRRRWWHF
ncbi:hypothetical protein [Kribbella ginsengisoli]|uniref:DUF3072 domain-containing protein n=1 Tax=Kribbella ginsengisoli TaxID=363865 RepID=A0ABP6X5R3_9ACTN